MMAVASQYTVSGSAAVVNCSAQYGGGIFFVQTSLRVTGSLSLVGNRATVRGGGVYLQYAFVTVVAGGAAIVRGNACAGAGCGGGGVAAVSGAMWTTTGNAAFTGGALPSPPYPLFAFARRDPPWERCAVGRRRPRLCGRSHHPGLLAAGDAARLYRDLTLTRGDFIGT